MKRREALKGLGLSLGYIIASPAAFSILQSCKKDTQTLWKTLFFDEDEGIILQNLVDLILPKTDALPGALDVNVPQFIDTYVAKVVSEEQQSHYKKGIKIVKRKLSKSVKKLNIKDYNDLLTKYLKANDKELNQFKNNDKLILETLVAIRSMSIWAYKNSEQVGENILAYDPIPGIQKGCVPLNETTGGKAWSL